MIWRLLCTRPGFVAIVLTTLSLGIGAPTAVYAVLHAVLLRPLPYPDAERLVRFEIESRSPRGSVTFDALPASLAVQWNGESTALTGIALYNDRALTLRTADGPERLSGLAATANLFDLLGIAPALGPGFDAATRDTRQIVLSDATWRRYFGADPNIVGAAIAFDGDAHQVVGVMPDTFSFPTADAAFWVPLVFEPGGGRGMLLPAVARMRPDGTIAATRDEGQRMLAETSDSRVEQTLTVRTLHEQLVGNVRRVLWLLFGAVCLVSVIATVNLALLLLVRGAGRSQEFSVRLALGASRAQLVRQLFAEALTLAAIGGAAGVALAALLLRMVVRLAPPNVPRITDAGIDAPVLIFAVLLTAATAIVFSALSAGRSLAVDSMRAFGGYGGESRLTGTRTSRRRMHVLAAAELALSVVLLVGAGLLLRSFVALVMVDQGFDGRGGIALRLSLPVSRYPNPETRLMFHERLLERLQTAPGIDSAGLITAMPNRQPSARYAFDPVGVPVFDDPFTLQVAEVRTATDGFFEAMGIPLRAGRTFAKDDRDGGEGVIVISEALARVHFGAQPAVGRMLYSGAAGPVRVIGVAADVRPADGGEPSPAAYLPLRQDAGVLRWFASINVLVRGADAGAMTRAARASVAALDPEIAVFSVRTLDEETSQLVAGPRFVASIVAAFAAVALVLAAVGVYGVMAYSSSLRTREIGVRIALGATREQVLHAMMRDGLLVVAGGLIVGLIAALWLSRVLAGVMHDVPPPDTTAVVTVAAILATAGAIATYVPTRRATRVNALEALRHQ